MRSFFALFLICCVCFFGAKPVMADFANAQKRLEFFSANSSYRNAWCPERKPSKFTTAPITQPFKTASGKDRPPAVFMNELGAANSHLLRTGSKADANQIADQLAAAAQARSFEKQGLYDGVKIDAAWWQANILLNLSMVHSSLSAILGKNDPRVVAIADWGDRLAARAGSVGGFEQMYGKEGHAARAAGLLAWGAETGNRKAFKKGERDLAYLARQMRPNAPLAGTFDQARNKRPAKRQLHYTFITYGYLVIAMDASRRGGGKGFRHKSRQTDIHGALVWLVQSSAAPNNPVGLSGPQDTFFWTTRSDRYHNLAWAEAYLRNYPNTQAGLLLKRKLKGQRSRGVFAGWYGGNLTCSLGPGS